MSVFGKAKFGGNKRTWFKLKDGKSVYRILPPMGDLQEEGRWSQFYSIHYGYKNSEGKMRTFVSPLVKNNKTKMIDVPDAALERITALTAKLDEAKKAGQTEQVAQLLKLVGGQKSRYNLDNNHYINVIDLQGNIGILKIRHKAKLALDAAIKQLREEGVDGGGLDPENGRFFAFSRSGTARDTIYQVSVYKEKLEVAGVGAVERDVVHTITEDIAKRCVVVNKDGSYSYKEAANLSTLFKKPSAEWVKRFVLEGETAVDEFFDSKGTASEEVDDAGSEDEVEAAPAVTATNTPTPNGTATTLADATKVTLTAPPTAPAPQAAAPAPAVTEAPKAAAAPKTTAEAVSEQTDQEFLKSLGL